MLKLIFNHDEYILPKIARMIFIIASIGIALMSVYFAWMTLAYGYGPIGWRFIQAVIQLIGGCLAILGLRLSTEVALVLFSINDTLKKILAK